MDSINDNCEPAKTQANVWNDVAFDCQQMQSPESASGTRTNEGLPHFSISEAEKSISKRSEDMASVLDGSKRAELRSDERKLEITPEIAEQTKETMKRLAERMKEQEERFLETSLMKDLEKNGEISEFTLHMLRDRMKEPGGKEMVNKIIDKVNKNLEADGSTKRLSLETSTKYGDTIASEETKLVVRDNGRLKQSEYLSIDFHGYDRLLQNSELI